MLHGIAAGVLITGLSLAGSAQAGVQATDGLVVLVTGQSQQQSSGTMSPSEQAKQSQETPSHSQFGGAAKDQATRERQHKQYPDSAQHLGPHEDEQGQGSRGTSGSGKTRPGHDDQKQDAVSGVGR